MRLAILAALLAIPACADETISAYARPGATYRLTHLDGATFPATATIEFPEKGVARGTGPCNLWSAEQTVPYPWIALGPIAATRRACPDLDAEHAFFDALPQMTVAVAENGVLTLSNDEGREMVFRVETGG